eukprot:15366482-Ditylum_brightwellii.AAC.1
MASRDSSSDPYGYNYGIDDISHSSNNSFSSSSLSHEEDIDGDDDGFLGWNQADQMRAEERRERRRQTREDQLPTGESGVPGSSVGISGATPGTTTGSDLEYDADQQPKLTGASFASTMMATSMGDAGNPTRFGVGEGASSLVKSESADDSSISVTNLDDDHFGLGSTTTEEDMDDDATTDHENDDAGEE